MQKLCDDYCILLLQFRNSFILNTEYVELKKIYIFYTKASKIDFHVYNSKVFVNFHIIFGCHYGIVLHLNLSLNEH